MRIVKAAGGEVPFLKEMQNRSISIDAEISAKVQIIIDKVRDEGDKALKEYTALFDKVELDTFEISPEEIKAAYDKCDRDLIYSLEKCAANIKDFHEMQKQETWKMDRNDGILLGQRVRGLARVGLYVPGGTAAYPSSVLMNAIPAKVAGVKELIMVTPPGGEHGINPAILAAAYIAGVDRVFRVGGAQAVAALAFGTESLPKVDKIVGPGNIFVATAKKLVYGKVDIDMIAGPSEVLILADGNANPKYVAADLMSQAEHDALASSILVTTSEALANRVIEELNEQSKALSRKNIIDKSLDDFGAIIITDTVDAAIDIANAVAPEHLEILFDQPEKYIDRIDNVGSVFLGEYSPEPLGDYFAGPNHVLPTSGTARFFSPLGVDAFTKKSSFIKYTREALDAAKEDIIRVAETEGLTAHANSVKVRFFD